MSREICPISEHCKEVPSVQIIEPYRKEGTDLKIVNKCQYMSLHEHCINGVIFTYEPRKDRE